MAEWVKVREMSPPGHVRTPFYLRGKVGQIERRLGQFPNPEGLAYNQNAEHRSLVRVRFLMSEVWGRNAENPKDFLEAEIYEHWLEAANAP